MMNYGIQIIKKKKEHIREIVDASMMTEKEIEEMREEFGPAIQMDSQKRYIERIIMPNLFDMRRNRPPLIQPL